MAPPSDVTLDAYAAHNDAVEVQRQWQESDDPEVAGLCAEFYDSPDLAQGLLKRSTEAIELGLEYESLLGGASRAQQEAADACAEGTELQPWHSDELEQQLAARREAETNQFDAARETAARAIDQVPRVCARIHDDLPRPRDYIKGYSAYEAAITRQLEKLPKGSEIIVEGANLDDVAESLVLACSGSPPATAAASLRNPGTPVAELEP